MNALSIPPRKEVVMAKNEIAALLSIVPGLGHIYKGHYAHGLVWMFLGMPLAFWVGILLGLATAGIGLFFPLACWVAVAIDAYYKRDLRKHHWFLPASDGSDEEEVAD